MLFQGNKVALTNSSVDLAIGDAVVEGAPQLDHRATGCGSDGRTNCFFCLVDYVPLLPFPGAVGTDDRSDTLIVKCTVSCVSLLTAQR